MSNLSIAQRLEKYTTKNPQEILIVHLQNQDDLDEIMIFKGFSSSLIQPTISDPDIPLINDPNHIVKIDRLIAPYHPTNPQIIQSDMTLREMEERLTEFGI